MVLQSVDFVNYAYALLSFFFRLLDGRGGGVRIEGEGTNAFERRVGGK